MERFSEKSLLALGEFYVYGLIDPRTDKIFYIGKGTGNRVFEHEKESLNNSDSEKLKLKTISEIVAEGKTVKRIIINSNLSEKEAYAAETSLINIFNYICDVNLTNVISGHHSSEVLTVEEFERIYGAEALNKEDIHHKVLVIKINKLFKRNMTKEELYDVVRGVWRASLKRVQVVDYVFGVYNSLIVAVYRPTKWYRCKDALDKKPKHVDVVTEQLENRIFFVDEDFENKNQVKVSEYDGKSIVGLKLNQSAQNPITYINC